MDRRAASASRGDIFQTRLLGVESSNPFPEGVMHHALENARIVQNEMSFHRLGCLLAEDSAPKPILLRSAPLETTAFSH